MFDIPGRRASRRPRAPLLLPLGQPCVPSAQGGVSASEITVGSNDIVKMSPVGVTRLSDGGSLVERAALWRDCGCHGQQPSS